MYESGKLKDNNAKPDPYKVYKAIADIIADREGIIITLKSVTKREKEINCVDDSQQEKPDDSKKCW